MTELVDFKNPGEDEWVLVDNPLDIHMTNDVLNFLQIKGYLSAAKIQRIRYVMSNAQVKNETFHDQVVMIIGEDITCVYNSICKDASMRSQSSVMSVQFKR